AVAGIQRPEDQRHLPVAVVSPYRFWSIPVDLPALQLYQLVAARDSRVGLHRRRVAVYDLPAPDPTAIRARAGLVRDLPVHVGLERLLERADLPGNGPRATGGDDQTGPDVRVARAGLAPVDGGWVHRDDSAVDRFLLTPALLRARPAGRLGEGIE